MINSALKKRFSTLITALFIAAGAFAQSSRPIVSSITAYAASATKITVSWVLPEKTEGSIITALQIYRDTKPIAGQDAVSSLAPLATLASTANSYTDTVTDYREYYYAVISMTKPGTFAAKSDLYYDEDFDKPADTSGGKAYIVLLPGVNATVNGVRVKLPVQKNTPAKKTTESAKEKLYGTGDMREQPLPFLDILGAAKEPDSVISKATEKKALAIAGGKQTHKQPVLLEPYYFEQDLMSPDGGDEFLLFEVLRTTFVKRNYPAATASLKRFLAQNRTAAVTDRANFYLGESYYFSGKYKDALNVFLELDETFTPLTQKWIESSLEFYEIPASENK